VARLEGRGGILERIVFERGEPLPRRALFFTLGQEQRSPLPALLGCEFTEKGNAATGWCESTNGAPLSQLLLQELGVDLRLPRRPLAHRSPRDIIG
jgi:hypothetical protein